MSTKLFRGAPVWLAVFATVSPLIAAELVSPTAKWITEQEPQWQATFQTEVSGPFQKAFSSLKKDYLTALETRFAAATRGAQLTDAVAFRTERERVESGADVPVEDENTDPAALKSLRAAYRQKLAALEAQRQANAKAAFGRIDTVLAQNQALLTQRQRLEEALELKAKREQLQTAWSQAPADQPVAAPASTPAKAVAIVATKERPFVNSLEMQFVPVPITSGPTKGQRILFSVWETRVQDYEIFAKESGRDWPKATFTQTAAHPAINVTWEDAAAFCAWLTERDRASGKIGAKDTFRLPLDHEWSAAVEIADREEATKTPALKDQKVINVFPWGNRWPPLAQAGNFSGEETAGSEASGSQKALTGYHDEFLQTAPVGSFAANRFGLYDLSGNVWEWCEDWIDAQQQGHVLRGGSWHDGVRDRLLASRRGFDPPTSRNAWNGFRCVLAVAGK